MVDTIVQLKDKEVVSVTELDNHPEHKGEVRTYKSSQNPLMSAWKSHWTGFLKASPHKYVDKGLVDHVRRYHMLKLAILSHKLIKSPWVNRIPIFMELKG